MSHLIRIQDSHFYKLTYHFFFIHFSILAGKTKQVRLKRLAETRDHDEFEFPRRLSRILVPDKIFSSQRSFEYLRLTSLGVIGALVKTDENDVINFLLTTEIVPLCLNIMETGSELSKTVATFILQKILVDNAGLEYICAVSFLIMLSMSIINFISDIWTILQCGYCPRENGRQFIQGNIPT